MNYLKPGTQRLIKHDQCLLSREILSEIKRDGRKGWRGRKKDDISWVIEMQRNRDGQDEKLVMRHWLALSWSWDSFHISTEEFNPECIDKCCLVLGRGSVCLINGWYKAFMLEDYIEAGQKCDTFVQIVEKLGSVYNQYINCNNVW